MGGVWRPPGRVRHVEDGQTLVELAIVMPLLVAAVAGGITLTRLAVGRAEVKLAAMVGAADSDPVQAARLYLKRNGLLDAERAAVQVQELAWLRQVTVTCPVSVGWWPGSGAREGRLVASAGRGRALLCIKRR